MSKEIADRLGRFAWKRNHKPGCACPECYELDSIIAALRSADEKAARLPEESLHKIAEIVRIHALYEGHPCNNKRHADSIVIAACGHQDDYVELTLGDCRALAAALEKEG